MIFYVFIFGLIIGSFINCLIYRLNKDVSLWGRSFCPKCKKQISWHDNIPIISFMLLKGRCRHCKNKISYQYPIVELITGILFAAVYIVNFQFLVFDNLTVIKFTRDLLLVFFMIVIFIYDLKWYLILDIITIPASILFFIFNVILGFNWFSLIILGIIGASFFLAQFLISRGMWIGGGDIRLGFLLGISLGRLDYLILAIVLGYFIGSIVGIGLIIANKKKWSSKIPLGIFLSTSTIITLLYGDFIINWYVRLF